MENQLKSDISLSSNIFLFSYGELLNNSEKKND